MRRPLRYVRAVAGPPARSRVHETIFSTSIVMLVILIDMNGLATLLGGILATLRTGIARYAVGDSARAVLLNILAGRIARMAARFDRLFARWQSGTLPSQTGAPSRPARAGQLRPTSPPRLCLPTGRMWLFHVAQPPAALALSHLQHWMAHPDLPAFLEAAPHAGRLLRPLCRLVGLEAQPGVPAVLNLPAPPPFRPSPPPPPPHLGIIDPPEVAPRWTRWHWHRQLHGPPYSALRI